MSTSAESLARELADMKRRLAALERGTQLQSSTVGTSGGTVSVVHGLEAGISAGAAAAEAITRAASAEAKADGAVHTYFGPNPPEGVQIGDLWRDDDGIVSQFDGEVWQPISSDADLSEALDRIAHTEEALDGKVSTFYQPSTRPPGMVNIVSNGNFEAGATGWNETAGVSFASEDAAKNGKYGWHIVASTTGNRYPGRSGDLRIPMATGETFYWEVDVRMTAGTAAANETGIAVILFTSSKTGNGSMAIRGSGGPTSPADGWRHLSGTFSIAKAGTAYAYATPWTYKNANGAEYDFDNLHVSRLDTDPNAVSKGDLWIVTDGGNLIRRWDGTQWVDAPAGAGALADRAVTSTKLETDLVLSSRVIAGQSATGNRAEMSQTGFSVHNGGREVLSLGADGQSDYLTIVKADGSAAAGISQSGVLCAREVSAGSKLWWLGREMGDITNEMPLGVLATGKRTTRSDAASAGQVIPFMRIDATLHVGRIYRLTAGPFYTAITSPGVAGYLIAYRYDNPCTTALNHGRLTLVKARTDHDILPPVSVTFEVEPKDGAIDAGQDYRSVSFLLAYTNLAGSGYVNLTPDNAQPTACHFTLEDMGRKYRSISAGHAAAMNLPNDGTTPDPAQPLVGGMSPTERANYVMDANGLCQKVTIPGAAADELYMGPWPQHAGSPRYVSACKYDGIATALTNSDVQAVQLLLNAKQWYYGAGGSVMFAVHKWSTLPDSFTLSDVVQLPIESAGMPNPGYRYINIPPALWNGFQTGQYRGFVFIGDGTLDSSAMFGNNYDVDPEGTTQLPLFHVGFTRKTGQEIA